MYRLWIMNDTTFSKLIEGISEDTLLQRGITIKVENNIKDEDVYIVEQPNFTSLTPLIYKEEL